MKRKIICTMLAILLLLASFTPIIGAASYKDQKENIEGKLDDAEDEKNKVTSQKKDALAEIEELDDSIMQYEKEIDDLEDEIAKTENNIRTKTKEIEALQKELEEKQELLKNRLVAIYEEGQITFLDVLLSSDNIWDYLAMEVRMREMAEADNKQMDEIEEQSKNLEKAKKELEKSKSDLDSTKKDVISKENSLKVAKVSKQAKVDTLTAEEKKIQKQMDEYKAEISRLEKLIREQANKASGVYSGSFAGTLGWPLSNKSSGYNVITSTFGPRNSPVAGASSNHRGIDIAVGIGTPVYASADGYVLQATSSSARGNFVLLKHASDLYTRYQHLSRYTVSTGQYVKRGNIIGYSGNTGIGSGAHLHFEILTTPYYMTEINPLTCNLLSKPSLIYR